jgi:hypothetical protein
VGSHRKGVPFLTLIHPTNELLCSDIIPRWAVIDKAFPF